MTSPANGLEYTDVWRGCTYAFSCLFFGGTLFHSRCMRRVCTTCGFSCGCAGSMLD